MPQGKKGRAFNNKKKKRGGQARPQQQPARNNDNSGKENGPRLVGDAPNFQDYHDRQQAQSTLQERYPTVYTRYKDATKRFLNYMQQHAPEEIREQGGKFSVNSLVIIADWMEETGFVVQKTVLKDLKLAIRIRTRVAISVFGGGDAGHRHFLTVLTYCWTILVNLTRAEPETVEQAGHRSTNTFAALQDDLEDENDTDEDFLPASRVPRPTPEPEPLSLQELIDSDDRNDAILFLLTMNELMGAVVDQYIPVANNLSVNRGHDVHDSAIVKVLLEAAVGTNMALQQLQQLEMEFEVQHPDITTPYRLLSLFALPEITQHVTEIVREHSPRPVHEKEVIAFLGDCIECVFRAPSDTHNKKATAVSDFCSRFEVDPEGQQQLEFRIEGLSNIIALEVPIGAEREQNSQIMASMSSHLPSFRSHSWIPSDMSFIGGDRAIHHTLRLLQSFGSVIENTPENQTLTAPVGFFGPSPWIANRTRTIHNDMDELLMANILPQWVMMCRMGILGMATLPRVDEITPLWVSIKNFIDNPEKPIRWSTVFAFHAMLTAVFETKGVVNDIMKISQQTYDHFFNELRWGSKLKTGDADAVSSRAFQHNIPLVMFLENFGLPVYGNLAMFNPLCAGTFFSYLTFFGNLEAGCSLIDDRAQLRMVLHLFNGLVVNNILRESDIPMLAMLHRVFKNSKAIWEGPLPRKGGLVERFWVAFGCSRKDAKKYAEESRKFFHSSSDNDPSIDLSKATSRQMKSLEPAQIAKCYRRICNRDFHDVVDNYHTPEQRNNSRGTDMYNLAVRINDTLDAIDDEHRLLAQNLLNWGILMEQFVCSLNRIMQWDEVMESLIAQNGPPPGNDKRPGTVFMFAQHLLGALDFANDPMDVRIMETPQGRASSSFLKVFFTQVYPKHVVWFQAIQEEDQQRAFDAAF